MPIALYDPQSPKKSANLSVNQDLLRQARLRKLNLSKLLEERLIEVLRECERDAWLAENATAINDYNQRIAENGVFSNELRRF